MSILLLKARLALELPSINSALNELLDTLPAPTRPAARHTVMAGGKRLRPALTILSARICGLNDKKIYKLAATLEMLHAATLMHDDVIDNASTRRGNPSAHSIFGITETILAGDALLSEANACVASYGNPRLCEIFSRATSKTAAGEILELHAMHNLALTEQEYMEIIRGKTAWLIRSACEMGAVYANASDKVSAALACFGENLGLAFQIVDDAIDCEPEAVTGKPTGGDIREGKLTPPVRMYRETLSGEALSRFDTEFTQGTFTAEEIEAICAQIRQQGFQAQTRTLANECLNKARAALEQLPDVSERKVLSEMADYVRDRNH